MSSFSPVAERVAHVHVQHICPQAEEGSSGKWCELRRTVRPQLPLQPVEWAVVVTGLGGEAGCEDGKTGQV